MKRRKLLKTIGSVFAGSLVAPYLWGSTKSTPNSYKNRSESDDRTYWIQVLAKMADPVLKNISQDRFMENRAMTYSPTFDNRNKKIGYMEAFCRLLAGMAPWLNLLEEESEEGQIRKKYRNQALAGLNHATNPKSKDYFPWNDESTTQPLVEAAFLAHALLRAPEGLWKPLPKKVKNQVINEFKGMRRIAPFDNNWLLFASIVEAFLYQIGETPDMKRINKAVEKFDKDWYVGDGWYSDGPRFSFDHYNSYVIHCMQVGTLKPFIKKDPAFKKMYDRAYKRMQRYAHHQERMISPQGYPIVVGRSSTYRTAAFQVLAAVAHDDKLPSDIAPSQVRAAMTAMYKNIFVENSFHEDGWLTLGYVGNKQQDIADYYTTGGSLYLTSLSFLPLGLPADHDFWTAKAKKWTAQKVFDGEPFPKDYVVDY